LTILYKNKGKPYKNKKKGVNMNRNLMKMDRPFLDFAKRFFDNDFVYNNSLFESKNGGLSNILEKENEYLIEITAPGLKKEDIKIELENDILRISSEIEDNKEDKNDGYYRREFYKSSFERSFTIPKIADKNAISAKMEDGILIVEIPKLKEEKSENIKITIK
jgi:HSP20 family protein